MSPFADTMEAVCGVFLFRRMKLPSSIFKRSVDLWKFFGSCAVVGPFIGATVGWLVGNVTGEWRDQPHEWLDWWLENMVGVLVVAPVVIAWLQSPPREIDRKRIIEGGTLLLSLVLLGYAVFGGGFPSQVKNYPLEFLCTPLLVWAALRFGPLGAATTVLVLSIIVQYGAAQGFGPFFEPVQFETIHLMQTYIATNAFLALLLAVISQEREQARKRLSQSNVELERFAYLASHDLQEPLRTVIAFSTLIQRKWDDSTQGELREYFDMVTNASKRMHALINSLLDYSRLGGRKIHFKTVSCEQILEDAKVNLKALTEQTGARIVSRSLPTLSADRVLFLSLFQNLMANAIKFHREGYPPSVEISAQLESPHWHFLFRDNGIGIEPQYSDRIFRLFERLNSTSSGTGLGLAVAKKVVEEHGGRIWVESARGAGSTFHFTLRADLKG